MFADPWSVLSRVHLSAHCTPLIVPLGSAHFYLLKKKFCLHLQLSPTNFHTIVHFSFYRFTYYIALHLAHAFHQRFSCKLISSSSGVSPDYHSILVYEYLCRFLKYRKWYFSLIVFITFISTVDKLLVPLDKLLCHYPFSQIAFNWSSSILPSATTFPSAFLQK